MKKYKKLIKKLEKLYNKKLEIKIEETKKDKCIYIYGINIINGTTLEILKEYCDYFYISSLNFKISITLIINK